MQWLTAEQLKRKWKCTDHTLFEAIKNGLQAYNVKQEKVPPRGLVIDRSEAQVRRENYLKKTATGNAGPRFAVVMERIAALCECVFKLEDVESIERLHAEEQKKDGRPVSPYRGACRAVAKQIWAKRPEITIAKMILRDEIAAACGNKVLPESTLRYWLKDLCPNRRPGRRP